MSAVVAGALRRLLRIAHAAQGPAAAAFIGALGGLVVALVAGLALDPNTYPLDRPAPRLAALATCPEILP